MIATQRLVSILPVFIAACTCLLAAEPAANDQPPLRVGVAPNMPPMIFKQGKTIAGVEADLAQALGRELNRPVAFVELAWVDLIDALEANKIDVIMS